MKYFKDQNGIYWVFEDYIAQSQIDDISIKNNIILTIDNIPIYSDGIIKPYHPYLNLLAIDSNGNKYEFYITTPDINGIYQPDTTKISSYNSEISIASKWDQVNLGRTTLTVTTTAGNKYAANREAINNMKSKIDVLINGATIKWVEDWGNWLVDAVELGEARDLAEKADQALIDSIFV